MSVRTGAIAGCALLLGLTACSRAPPSPSAEATPAPSADAAAPIELAGAPPADTAPAIPAPDQPTAPDAPAAADAAPPSLAGGAPPPAMREPAAADPLEPVNRSLYAVDKVVGRAIAKRPAFVRHSEPHARAVVAAAGHVLENLDEPGSAANHLLQRKLGLALKSAVRFVVNSTLGLGGLNDVASRMGFPRRPNNLERTLAAYGAPRGPYLYLPIAGPTTLRAAAGAAIQGYLYPPHWMHLAEGFGAALRGATYVRLARKAVVHAAALDSAEPGADGYLRARKAYFQARSADAADAPPRPPITTLASAAVVSD